MRPFSRRHLGNSDMAWIEVASLVTTVNMQSFERKSRCSPVAQLNFLRAADANLGLLQKVYEEEARQPHKNTKCVRRLCSQYIYIYIYIYIYHFLPHFVYMR